MFIENPFWKRDGRSCWKLFPEFIDQGRSRDSPGVARIESKGGDKRNSKEGVCFEGEWESRRGEVACVSSLPLFFSFPSPCFSLFYPMTLSLPPPLSLLSFACRQLEGVESLLFYCAFNNIATHSYFVLGDFAFRFVLRFIPPIRGSCVELHRRPKTQLQLVLTLWFALYIRYIRTERALTPVVSGASR